MQCYPINAVGASISEDLAEVRRKLRAEGLAWAREHRRMLRQHFHAPPGARQRRREIVGTRWLPGFRWNGIEMEYSESPSIDARSASQSAPVATIRRRSPDQTGVASSDQVSNQHE